MSDVFLSYDRSDRDRARIFVKAFQDRGVELWWDRNIPISDDFSDYIESEIDKAKCVVVLWSQKSISSKWVRREARHAAEQEKLVPVMIDDVKLPLEFNEMQTVQLAGWTGTSTPEEFERLVEKVVEITGGDQIDSKPKPLKEKSKVITDKIEELIKEADTVLRWVDDHEDFRVFTVRNFFSNDDPGQDVMRVLKCFVHTCETLENLYGKNSDIYQEIEVMWQRLIGKYDEIAKMAGLNDNIWSMVKFAIVDLKKDDALSWVHEKAKRASSDHLTLLIQRLQKHLYYE